MGSFIELAYWDEDHNLGKYCASLVHCGDGSGLSRKVSIQIVYAKKPL